ncbi:MAG: YbjN domain-containing protein [Rhodothalassiaceae bacterium]
MTALIADEFMGSADNPLDLVEDCSVENDWVYDRPNDEELTAAVPGTYCEFQLRFFWREEGRILQIANVFDARIPEAKTKPIYETLARINERLWLGHFELWSEEGVVMFRHSTILDGELSRPHLELLVETALSESERFYPVFQFVLWAGKTPEQAIEAALLDVAGEA